MTNVQPLDRSIKDFPAPASTPSRRRTRTVQACVAFCDRELSALIVLRVSPGESILNHFHVDETVPQEDAAGFAL
ncbi:MAG TPA: hypothetical protein VMR25_24080, partial [Planctomycetaceae bacterium]|nr:hypothetical protein [Planctomycetaceae bacterium]